MIPIDNSASYEGVPLYGTDGRGPVFSLFGRKGWRSSTQGTPYDHDLLGDRLIEAGRVDAELMHGIVFLGYLAVKHLGMSNDETLGDNGIVHRAAHQLMGVKPVDFRDSFEKLALDVKDIQLRLEALCANGQGIDI